MENKDIADFSVQTSATVDNVREPVALNAASVKLPSFSRTDSQVWFRRAETQFRLKGVSQSCTKADHVLASIPDEIFSHIAHWLNEQPDQLSYGELKSYLLKEFSLKPAERAQRVLALATQPLGDVSAHRAWYEMQSLLTLPSNSEDPEAEPVKVDLERELWLQRLPESVRAALPCAESMPIDSLIDHADALIAAEKAATRSMRPMVSGVEEGVNSVGRRSVDHNWRDDRHRKRGYLTSSGLCNYHFRWGKAARACVDGCKWTKNGASGR